MLLCDLMTSPVLLGVRFGENGIAVVVLIVLFQL